MQNHLLKPFYQLSYHASLTVQFLQQLFYFQSYKSISHQIFNLNLFSQVLKNSFERNFIEFHSQFLEKA